MPTFKPPPCLLSSLCLCLGLRSRFRAAVGMLLGLLRMLVSSILLTGFACRRRFLVRLGRGSEMLMSLAMFVGCWIPTLCSWHVSLQS